ncbi:hypothetical protein [Halorubrum sp. DTA46]|uniref:hypothetical protein n=1 Tax=Halorubrum sp. DTA46 TaxID=3402162 RepID=UPI003AACCB60
MSDDPFAERDADEAQRDPVDDPFARLGEGVDGSATEATEATETDDPQEQSTATGAVDPFDELGPTTETESVSGLEDAFEQMDVSGPAAEDVWESLDEDAFDAGPAVGADDARESAASPRSADSTGSGVEHVVNKRTHCQRCPHFSAPPNVACGHEGTTIVEAASFDEFRVRNCPMVSEDAPTFDADE